MTSLDFCTLEILSLRLEAAANDDDDDDEDDDDDDVFGSDSSSEASSTVTAFCFSANAPLTEGVVVAGVGFRTRILSAV